MAIGTSLKDESGNEFSDFEIDQSDDRESDDEISDIYEIRRKSEKEKAEDFIERTGSINRGSSHGRFNRDYYRLNFELSDSSSEAGFHLKYRSILVSRFWFMVRLGVLAWDIETMSV